MGIGRFGRFLVAVAVRFYEDNCLRHAAALAYTTLLSLVPLFALMFAVLKGLGVQRRLEPLLLSRLALDPTVVEQTMQYIDNTNVGTLGTLGAAALVLTVWSVLGSVESTLNDIWRVKHGRSWLRVTTDYLSVVLLTPLLLFTAVALTSSVQEQRILETILHTEYVGELLLRGLRLAPVVFNIMALAIIYAVMPNRRPNAKAIVLGAVVAGIAWNLTQWAYVAFQIGVSGYSAIYGAVAQLPITLAWIYVSWAIVLAGAELAAVFELGVKAATPVLPASRRAVALHVLVRAGERLKYGGEPIEPGAIASELGADADAVSEVILALVKEGWLVPVEGERPVYVLARDPASIELAKLPQAVVGEGIPANVHPQVCKILTEIGPQERAAWHGRTLADLLAESDEPAPLGVGASESVADAAK